MEENVKPLTAEELHDVLCDPWGPGELLAIGRWADREHPGKFQLDGSVDLRALAAWINKRMGATEGSE